MKMRKLKQANSLKTGPTTDEEVARLQAMEQEAMAKKSFGGGGDEEEDPYEGM